MRRSTLSLLDPNSPLFCFSDGGDGAGGDGGAGDGGDPPAGGDDKGGKPNVVPKVAPKESGDGDDEAAKKARQEVADLPELAQKLIREARDDAAKARKNAATAAETSQANLIEKLSVALGVKADKKADPEQLAKDLSEAQAARLSDQRELAVFRHAGKDADPDRLLDSRKFMAALGEVEDPKDDKAVKKVISDFVRDNPSYKAEASKTRGSSAADHSGGPKDRSLEPLSLSAALAKQNAGASR